MTKFVKPSAQPTSFHQPKTHIRSIKLKNNPERVRPPISTLIKLNKATATIKYPGSVDRFFYRKFKTTAAGLNLQLTRTEKDTLSNKNPIHKNYLDGLANALDMTRPSNDALNFGEILRLRPAVTSKYKCHFFKEDSTLQDREPKSNISSRISIPQNNLCGRPAGFKGDFEANNLAWSRKLNLILMAVRERDPRNRGNDIMIWKPEFVDSQVSRPTFLEANHIGHKVTGLNVDSEGNKMVLGLVDGTVQVWDLLTLKKLTSFQNPNIGKKVQSLSLCNDILTFGDMDGHITSMDLKADSVVVNSHKAHGGRVCNLKWRDDGDFLCSGGSDGIVKVFDRRSLEPVMTKSHIESEVKALSWCPWKASELASGGSAIDGTIKLWDISTSSLKSSIHTGSQTTSLQYSWIHQELLATHANPANNFTIWNHKDHSLVADIKAHNDTILESALSPNGLKYCTLSNDRTIKLWNAFDRSQLDYKNFPNLLRPILNSKLQPPKCR